MKRNNGTLPPQDLSGVNMAEVNTQWAKCKKKLASLEFDREHPEDEPALMIRPYSRKCEHCKNELSERSRRLAGAGFFTAYEKKIICDACKIEFRKFRIAFNDVRGVYFQELM